MKYVIELVQQGDIGALRVHVFSEDVNHNEYAKHPEGRPVGAGFCHLVHGRTVTSGKSISLRLTPHRMDANILAHFFLGSFEQQRFLLAEFYQL